MTNSYENQLYNWFFCGKIGKGDRMNGEYTLEEMSYVIKKSWCRESCYPKYQDVWRKENPSYGQDVVTSLLLYDYFKGNIKKCYVGETPHYFNIINKEIIDLTKEQFLAREIPYEKAVYKKRSDLLKNKNVYSRYILLRERVEGCLEQ